jgi:hypothetical protein
MLNQEVTPEIIKEWKEIWIEYKDKIFPNRKSGKEVLAYLKREYILKEIKDETAKQVVIKNIIYNEPYADKLPVGEKPLVAVFIVENKDKGSVLYENQDEVFKGIEIFVGIDLVSGFFCVEGSSLLWEELFIHQGLDKKDIQNYYLVAKYISCLKKYGLLEGF